MCATSTQSNEDTQVHVRHRDHRLLLLAQHDRSVHDIFLRTSGNFENKGQLGRITHVIAEMINIQPQQSLTVVISMNVRRRKCVTAGDHKVVI